MKTISSLTADQFKEMIINSTTKDPSIPKSIKESLKKENITITAKVGKNDILENINITIEVNT